MSDHLDNDKEELKELLYEFLNDYKQNKYLTQSNTNEAVEAINQYTQSKLKAFAGELTDLIPDEKVGTEKIPLNDIERGYNIAIQDVNLALKAIKGKAGIE